MAAGQFPLTLLHPLRKSGAGAQEGACDESGMELCERMLAPNA